MKKENKEMEEKKILLEREEVQKVERTRNSPKLTQTHNHSPVLMQINSRQS